MRLVRDVYYSIFVLSFRASALDFPSGRARVGLAVITTIQAIFLLAISEWSEVFLGRDYVAEWMVVLVYCLLLLFNNWVLCQKGNGLEFEEHFDGLPKTKRITLRSISLSLIIAVFCFFYWSLGVYRAKHNIA